MHTFFIDQQVSQLMLDAVIIETREK